MSASTYASRFPSSPPITEKAIAEAHKCPIEECTILCSPGHVACRDHWLAIPKFERVPLIEAFRRRQSDPIGYQLAVGTAHRLLQQWNR